MRILIAAVGRARDGPEQALVRTYLDRAASLGRGVGVSGIRVTEIAESTSRTPELRRAEEAERLLQTIPPRALLVALDGSGKERTSEAFAGDLRHWLDDGTSELAFLLGGPDGHDAPVLARSAQVLCLGRMTWPHLIARVLLAEQIYRSVTILANHPYHRG